MKSFKQLSAALLVFWLILPLIPLAIWSFAHGWFYPELLPQRWSVKAWEYALSDSAGAVQSLGLTIGISASATTLSVLVGVPAGRALGLYHFRGKTVVEILFLAPIVVPGIAVLPGLHSMFILLGLNNTIPGVVLVHLIPTLPYMVLVMASVFANFDPAIEQQARVLGASQRQVLWHVTLPAILPGIVAGALFAFLISWSQYILTLMIGGGRVLTLPLLLFNFATSGRNDITGAIGMIYILPGLLILLFTARHLTGKNAALGGISQA
ncbi:MAG: ABC transporter permease [Granulosicoccus sp.]